MARTIDSSIVTVRRVTKEKPLPLARFELKQKLMKKYHGLVPDLTPYQRRRIRGQQEIICRYEPERAISTLPQLLSDRDDRRRFLTLFERLLRDPLVNPTGAEPSREQTATLRRIREVLSEGETAAAA